MRTKILKIILWWQGLYYGLTGIWAIVALDNFSKVTGHFGDAFEMHSISALAVVLGLAFIFGAVKTEYIFFSAWLVLGSALAVIIPEIVYFPEVKNTLFFFDLLEEIAVTLVIVWGLTPLEIRQHKNYYNRT